MSDIEDLQIELENTLEEIDERIIGIKRYLFLKAVLWWLFGISTGWLLCAFLYKLVN